MKSSKVSYNKNKKFNRTKSIPFALYKQIRPLVAKQIKQQLETKSVSVLLCPTGTRIPPGGLLLIPLIDSSNFCIPYVGTSLERRVGQTIEPTCAFVHLKIQLANYSYDKPLAAHAFTVRLICYQMKDPSRTVGGPSDVIQSRDENGSFFTDVYSPYKYTGDYGSTVFTILHDKCYKLTDRQSNPPVPSNLQTFGIIDELDIQFKIKSPKLKRMTQGYVSGTSDHQWTQGDIQFLLIVDNEAAMVPGDVTYVRTEVGDGRINLYYKDA